MKKETEEDNEIVVTVLDHHNTFVYGDRVRKKSGSQWQGRIVGWYTTDLTPEGYAVESESHPGSVQIYPAKALEFVPVAPNI